MQQGIQDCVLDICDLPTIHPLVGRALMQGYPLSAVIRLSQFATESELTSMSRPISVNWRSRSGQTSEIVRSISWARLGQRIPELEVELDQYDGFKPELEKTEDAAVLVMALLIAHLENVNIRRVCPIGSGADYYCQIVTDGFNCEVSGIAVPKDRWRPRERLSSKTDQLLGGAQCGFVSVTTFAFPNTGATSSYVHSYMHFVTRPISDEVQ